ncbi:MAG TPA: antibiotic biosynthesis monooxygenase [Candidatus Nitrosotenuis sp.]|nr:antibiotic biosynthesis monooxygenase [Candidatus Nitrosotenuis sp.]
MFVGIIQFPKIKDGCEGNFLKWFEWSTSELAKFDGFLSRKLLQVTGNEKNYVAILELKDANTYRTIHHSKIHQVMFSRLVELLDGIPKKVFHESLIP